MTNEDLEFFKEKFGGDLSKGMGISYNSFACEEAMLIAGCLETEERIIAFSKKDWNEQKKEVRLLSEDHSGGTFNMSIRLAIMYLPMLKANKRDDKIEIIIKED